MITVRFLKELIKDIPDDVFVAADEDLIEFISLNDDNEEVVHKFAVTDNQFLDTSLMRNRIINFSIPSEPYKEDHPWMQ